MTQQVSRNNIGLTRLFLAALVIVSHAPEILDGNRHREPLTSMFGTLSFGDVAVDAFFALSGFLITKSILRTQNLGVYALHRIARIYPAFIACFLMCAFVFAPSVGGAPFSNLGLTIFNLLTLHPPPTYAGQLRGFPYPVINGAMWSISYEFRCYIFAALLFLIGVLNNKWFVTALTIAFFCLLFASTTGVIPLSFDHWIPKGDWLFGSPRLDARLFLMFSVGMSICLFEPEFRQHVSGLVAASCFLITCCILCFPRTAEIAVASFGFIFLFWFVLKANIGVMQRINDRWDISYGTYLYGWPAAVIIAFYWRDISVSALMIVSLAAAALAGSVSWFCLEANIQKIIKRVRPRPS